jgi:hypothetical protein
VRRREFMTLAAGSAITWPLRTYAQRSLPARSKRVGFLDAALGCPPPPNNASSRRLAELGWIEGHGCPRPGLEGGL